MYEDKQAWTSVLEEHERKRHCEIFKRVDSDGHICLYVCLYIYVWIFFF